MSLFSRKSHQNEQVADVEAEGPARAYYGIDDTVQLMRTLPVDQHPDLVVRVVKSTLASMNVKLTDILRDAAAKHQLAVNRIGQLKTNVAELEEQLRARKQEVESAEADLAELTQVTERLEAAAGAREPAPGASAGPTRTSAAAPRLPPPPVRSKPPTNAPGLDGDRQTMEVRDSAIELEPARDNTAK
jgi:hypothetical protein